MDLELTDDQVLFHETTVRFIESELPMTKVRQLHDDAMGYDRGWLGKAAELGWFAMLVPEEYGGGTVSGSGLVDASIVAEEIGRRMQPGPFLSMNVVAAALAEHASPVQCEALLPAIVAGELVAAWCICDLSGGWDRGAGLTATPSARGFLLNGARGFVQDAHSADWLLVAASVEGASAQLVVEARTPGITITPLATLDLSRRLANVSFDDVFVADGGLVGGIGADAALDRQLHIALALQCAETVGVLDAMFSMTVEYAKDRTAFGRPIGSFQALKHLMADLGLSLETSKAGAAALAAAVSRRSDDAAALAHTVAAYIGDVATDIGQECLQIHGGIGYTWEHDLHLFLRRARSNSSLYGEPSWHRERLCVEHGL
jgi:alkylation response protein AidB-like acyl-CoA dehydrogenase